MMIEIRIMVASWWRLAERGHRGTFWDNGSIPYLELLSVYLYPDLLNYAINFISVKHRA